MAVWLPSGDILMFNPHCHHCLSFCQDASLGVHVTTMHSKTGHLGKNDNNVPLTPTEMELLQEAKDEQVADVMLALVELSRPAPVHCTRCGSHCEVRSLRAFVRPIRA